MQVVWERTHAGSV